MCEVDGERVVGERLRGKPVEVLADCLSTVRPKEPIPNDEHSRVVAVAGGAVMHAVRHRRVEHVLEWKWKAFDEVRVDPELIERVQLRMGRERIRRKADQGEREVERPSFNKSVHESLFEPKKHEQTALVYQTLEGSL